MSDGYVDILIIHAEGNDYTAADLCDPLLGLRNQEI